MKTRMKQRKRKSKKSKKSKKTKIGGYKQYLSNVGFSNGYQLGFDRTMNTPSAIRTSTNWA
jgi:hypothetical protein